MDLAKKELAELDVIQKYLPQMATHEEIEKVARAKKLELGVIDTAGAGKLTGAILKEFGGRADGTVVKSIVAEILAE